MWIQAATFISNVRRCCSQLCSQCAGSRLSKLHAPWGATPAFSPRSKTPRRPFMSKRNLKAHASCMFHVKRPRSYILRPWHRRPGVHRPSTRTALGTPRRSMSSSRPQTSRGCLRKTIRCRAMAPESQTKRAQRQTAGSRFRSGFPTPSRCAFPMLSDRGWGWRCASALARLANVFLSALSPPTVYFGVSSGTSMDRTKLFRCSGFLTQACAGLATREVERKRARVQMLQNVESC